MRSTPIAMTSIICLCLLLSSLAATAAEKKGLRAMTNKKSPLLCHITMEVTSTGQINSTQLQRHIYHQCNPVENGEVSDFSYTIDLPTDFVEENNDALLSGTLFVSIPDGEIVDTKVVFPNGSVIAVESAPQSFEARRLVTTTGTKTLLVLRISANDATPGFTAQQLYSFTFDDSQPTTLPSLKSQYAKLSFGKLNFIPTQYGVMEVSVNMNANGAGPSTIRDAATAAVQAQYGVSAINALADHVMFCIPPGTGDWAGTSSVNSWRTVLNDQWCGYISGTMHEMGHNLGLLHSNQGGVAYMDYTSYMSAGVAVPYYPMKSFNGANNWQLGWYSDRQVTVDPSQGGQVITLATFVDYGKSNKANPVLIKVGDDTFLQYNRAKDFNYQTQSNIDQVTIVQQQSSGSSLLGGINMKSSQLTISNFNGSGRTLVIVACSVGAGTTANPDWMSVSVGFDTSYCTKSTSATAPTMKPTMKPTRKRKSPTAAR